MSDLIRAKAILDKLLLAELPPFVRHGIVSARVLMDREKPDFVVEPFIPPLTESQVQTARAMRAGGMALQKIADTLGSQIGRISEAVNGKREGI